MNRHPECGHGNTESTYCCCICEHNPCDRVTVGMVMDHIAWREENMRAAWERSVNYVLEHGHREPDLF